jgi:hypothetical protein
MPYAFFKTGVLLGTLLMGIVAYANAFTARMLLQTASSTNSHTYEACAEAVGGPAWKARSGVGVLPTVPITAPHSTVLKLETTEWMRLMGKIFMTRILLLLIVIETTAKQFVKQLLFVLIITMMVMMMM